MNSENKLLFGGRFLDVLDSCSEEFWRHFPNKGDSWKDLERIYLNESFCNLLDDWIYRYGGGEPKNIEAYNDLVDIINYALIIASRIILDRKERDKVI